MTGWRLVLAVALILALIVGLGLMYRAALRSMSTFDVSANGAGDRREAP